MNVPWQIVIASSDLESRRALSNILEKQGLDPLAASTVRECKEYLAKKDVRLLFCDRTLADGDYHDLLNASRAEKLQTRIVVTSNHADWDEYLEAMRLGAFDVIASPCRPTDVEWVILQALRFERTQPAPAATAVR
jgi:two-component system response regulator PilR (NtrC family)